MANVILDTTTDLGSLDLSIYLRTQTIGGYLLEDGWTSDVVLRLLMAVPDTAVSKSRDEYRLVGSNPRTIVKRYPSFFDNLRLAWNVIMQNSAPQSRGADRWFPRISVAVGGAYMKGYQSTTTRLSDYYSVDSSKINERVFSDFLITKHAGPYGTRLLFASVWRLLNDMFRGATNASFEKSTPPGFHKSEMSKIYLTDSMLSYHMDCHGYSLSNHNTYLGTSSYDVTLTADISRSSFTLKLSNFKVWRMLTDKVVTAVIDPFARVTRQKTIISRSSKDTYEAKHLLDASSLSIMSSRPALYHTQSGATHSLLGEVSKQFESLMESPGFLSEVLPAAADLPVEILRGIRGKKALAATTDAAFVPLGFKTKASAQAIPLYERVQLLLKLLSGAYLAYIFAIKPTLEGAVDVLQDHLSYMRTFTGEKSLIRTGVAADFANLPPTLKSYLQQMCPGPIQSYEVRFRTQITLRLGKTDVIDAIIKLCEPVARLGVLPEPKYLWQAGKFTFVVDMLIPMSSLIQSAQDFFSSFRLRRSRIGHSVWIRLVDDVGVVREVYIRSDETDTFIDPPPDTWLQSGGLKSGVMIPLALSLLL